jgi:vitamin B12 transporter
MRSFIPLLIFLLFQIPLFAQLSVSGTTKDIKGKPIPGVSISLKDSYDGGTTDSAGQFSFKTTEKGDHLLVVSSIGYKTFEQKVQLGSTPLKFDFTLKEEINELKAVVITAGSFEASDKKKATVLNSIDIVTTASANADITGAIKTLPGAQQVGESEGLFVRGGTAAETRTYIDGSLVNNFFFTSVPDIAQRGRFSPFIFNGTVFSAGGYSALYGQALSSALILESIDLPDRSSASLGISPIGLSGGYQSLAKNNKSSWGINYGYTNVKLAYDVLKPTIDYYQTPEFHAGEGNFRIKTSKTGMLKYYGYFSTNRLGIRTNSIDTLGYKDAFALKNFNTYQNVSWRQNIGGLWKINAGASYTNNHDQIDGHEEDAQNQKVLIGGLEYKNFLLAATGNYFNAKLVLERRLKGLSAIRFGSEYNYSNDHSDYTLYNGQNVAGSINQGTTAGFAEADIYVTNDLAAKIGTRAEYSSLLNKVNIAPRISLAYKLGDQSQASLAYGEFYQNPEVRYLPSAADLSFARATHYIAQYQKTSSLVTFRVEAFYKKYENLLKTTLINNRDIASGSLGYGEAKGFELFWRDKQSINNFDYWISYSYLDTKRDFLNYPAEMQPNFASRHTASLVLKKFVSHLKTQFNASYTYASPRPYYNIRYDYANSKYNISDQGETISYNSLGLSVNYLPNVFKKGANKFTVFVFSITNALGNDQVFGYKYSYTGYRKEAIVPPTKTFVYLGVFLSFGVDRSQDVINSNL